MDAREREELLDRAEERIMALIVDCYRQVEAVRAETEALTGLPVQDPAAGPRGVPYVDLDLPAVLEVQGRCAAFQGAAVLLLPLLEAAPHRVVGAVLKTADPQVAASIREGLEGSAFFEGD